ncbi:MAG TPA: recombination mediator RecR [Candidatus Brocadiia bacterium]|nr:recombination mediator RecR [Candidatus Brocadiales bacterium]
MRLYPQSMTRLIEELGKMPGIGQKTAERLANYILRLPAEDAMALAQAIQDLKKSVRNCSICFNITETDPCHICQDANRDRTVVCVVEQPADVITIEKTGQYNGLYHVLLGHISPLESIDPEDLTMEKLLSRVKDGTVKEVIIATNLNMEGDATALYISKQLEGYEKKVTRLARGMPSGGQLEYASVAVIADSLQGRRII